MAEAAASSLASGFRCTEPQAVPVACGPPHRSPGAADGRGGGHRSARSFLPSSKVAFRGRLWKSPFPSPPAATGR